MQNAFQTQANGGVAEDEATHRGAIERPGRQQDVRAKCSGDRGHGGTLRAGQFVRNGIGVDDGNPQSREDIGDRALAATNPAGQADNEAHATAYLALQDATRTLGKAPEIACRTALARGSGPRSSSR